jgi:hypothetical protein
MFACDMEFYGSLEVELHPPPPPRPLYEQKLLTASIFFAVITAHCNALNTYILRYSHRAYSCN